MRFIRKSPLLNTIYYTTFTYSAPSNFSYWWNFGSLAMFCLVVQIITGIFLAMHYTPHVDLAFFSVEHIMRDVNYGWLLRYLHLNGASFFFLAVYIHVFRGLYYGSYNRPRELVWVVGVAIIFLMILTAFMGYVLPWGQMSFWAATVITNLASAVPFFGKTIVLWLWGGFSVDNATLNRFFSFHYLMPFVIVALVFLHIIFLREHGSSNPLGVVSYVDKIPFPYYIIKDIYGIVLYSMLYGYFVFFEPNYLGHPDNYIPANPLVTPAHIVPEWYFLPFYAILRSIPDKLTGVIFMMISIAVLFILPYLSRSVIRSFTFRPLYKIFFWFFFLDCLFLGWLGGKPAEYPYVDLSRALTIFYFLYFLVFIPGIQRFEYKYLIKP